MIHTQWMSSHYHNLRLYLKQKLPIVIAVELNLSKLKFLIYVEKKVYVIHQNIHTKCNEPVRLTHFFNLLTQFHSSRILQTISRMTILEKCHRIFFILLSKLEFLIFIYIRQLMKEIASYKLFSRLKLKMIISITRFMENCLGQRQTKSANKIIHTRIDKIFR